MSQDKTEEDATTVKMWSQYLVSSRPGRVQNVDHSCEFRLTARIRVCQAELLLFLTLVLLLVVVLLLKARPVLLNHLDVDLNSGQVDGKDVAKDEAGADEEGEADSTLVTQVQKPN